MIKKLNKKWVYDMSENEKNNTGFAMLTVREFSQIMQEIADYQKKRAYSKKNERIVK